MLLETELLVYVVLYSVIEKVGHAVDLNGKQIDCACFLDLWNVEINDASWNFSVKNKNKHQHKIQDNDVNCRKHSYRNNGKHSPKLEVNK